MSNASSHLVIFDIDGTLTDSVKTDDKCMAEALKTAVNIEVGEIDWSRFEHPTDAGITNELLNNDASKIKKLKSQFLALMEKSLESDPSHFKMVKGAGNLLSILQKQGFDLAIATGSWKASGLLKLSQVAFDTATLPYAHSDDHYARVQIAQAAIARSKQHCAKQDWDRTTYIGDGVWDFATAQKLGLDFIGIDLHDSQTLLGLGNFPLFRHWQDTEKVLLALENGKA